MMMSLRADDVAPYVATASLCPALEREEEIELARRWQGSRDPRAGERLARTHLRIVVGLARMYRRYGVPLSELVAEGNFGLLHALNRFDPSRGLRLATYAGHWVRAFILDHVIKSWSLVRGALCSRIFFKLRRERVRLHNALGPGEAAERALAERLNMTVDGVRRLTQRVDARDVSLEHKLSDDTSTRLIDTLPANNNVEAELDAHEVRVSMRRAVAEAVETLDPRERFITEQRLMADASDALSLTEIGRRLGVSSERARQLETRAKNKLKKRIEAVSDAHVSEWLTEYGAPAASA